MKHTFDNQSDSTDDKQSSGCVESSFDSADAVEPQVLQPLPILRTYADGSREYDGGLPFSADELAAVDQFSDAFASMQWAGSSTATKLWRRLLHAPGRRPARADAAFRSVFRRALAEDPAFRRLLREHVGLVVEAPEGCREA